jgi:transcriptional/translational regulatory protein YebC/TACO1
LVSCGKGKCDEVSLELIDLGASDVEIEGRSVLSWVSGDSLQEFSEKVREKGLDVLGVKLIKKPFVEIEVSEKIGEKLEKLKEGLLKVEEVNEVWVNYKKGK